MTPTAAAPHSFCTSHGAQVAVTDLEEGVPRLVVEGIGLGSGDGAAVLDIGAGFVARQQPEGGVVRQALGYGDLVGAAQQGAQGRLSGQHHGDDEAAVHLEVGQQAQHGQGFGP